MKTARPIDVNETLVAAPDDFSAGQVFLSSALLFIEKTKQKPERKTRRVKAHSIAKRMPRDLIKNGDLMTWLMSLPALMRTSSERAGCQLLMAKSRGGTHRYKARNVTHDGGRDSRKRRAV